MQGRDEKCRQNFSWETSSEDGRMLLDWLLGK